MIMKKNNFILPDFSDYLRNQQLIKFYNKYPWIFISDVSIYSFYGTFPNAIFNGGRVIKDKKDTSFFKMKKVKKFYNKNNIRITLTFTNQCLEEKHLKDKYCNQILKIFHDGYNEVLVASPILEKYIRENYPKYKINKSITATIKDGNEDYSNYNLLVIDKKNNRNFEYLESIRDKSRIEILCDETCINDCKYTNQHYKEISLLQLGIVNEKIKDYASCRYFEKDNGYNVYYKRNKFSDFYISPLDVRDIYNKLGFYYMKLSGRGKYSIVGTESILNYLIKNQYFNDVITFLLEGYMLVLDKELKDELYGRESN